MNKHLYIEKPCPKKWEELIPNDLGRYCYTCNKTVHDLDLPDSPRPGDKEFTGCGKLTAYKPEINIVKLSSFQGKMIRWFGLVGMFFIPLKKAKTQIPEDVLKREVDPVTKKFYNHKRVVGSLRQTNRKLPAAKIHLLDGTGIVAESKLHASGKFILDIDTTKIKGDSVSIVCDDDSLSLNVKLDTSLVSNYPKDSLYIVICPYTLTGVVASGGFGPPVQPLELPSVTTITIPYLGEVQIPDPNKKKDPLKENEEKSKAENLDIISLPDTGSPEKNEPKPLNNTVPELLAVLNEDKKRKIVKGSRTKTS